MGDNILSAAYGLAQIKTFGEKKYILKWEITPQSLLLPGEDRSKPDCAPPSVSLHSRYAAVIIWFYGSPDYSYNIDSLSHHIIRRNVHAYFPET